MALNDLHYHQPEHHEGYYRLYTRASQEQWAVGALPWQQLGTLDPDWRDGMIRLLSPLLVSERGAMQACGTMLPVIRAQGEYDAELVMHAMMLDEARHWEGLNRFFIEARATPSDIAENRDMLGINLLIMRGTSFDQWLWCIQISDIIAGNLYAAFRNSCQSQPIVEMFAGFLRDESRHHRFCQLYFAEKAQHFTPEQRKRFREHGGRLLGKFEKMVLGRLRDDLIRIGADPKKIFHKIATAVDRQADEYGL